MLCKLMHCSVPLSSPVALSHHLLHPQPHSYPSPSLRLFLSLSLSPTTLDWRPLSGPYCPSPESLDNRVSIYRMRGERKKERKERTTDRKIPEENARTPPPPHPPHTHFLPSHSPSSSVSSHDLPSQCNQLTPLQPIRGNGGRILGCIFVVGYQFIGDERVME